MLESSLKKICFFFSSVCRSRAKTVHDRISLTGLSQLPSVPQIAKVILIEHNVFQPFSFKLLCFYVLFTKPKHVYRCQYWKSFEFHFILHSNK